MENIIGVSAKSYQFLKDNLVFFNFSFSDILRLPFLLVNNALYTNYSIVYLNTNILSKRKDV